MREPPDEGEPESMEWKGKTCNWCAKHKVWVIQNPKDCHFDVKERLNGEQDSVKNPDSPERLKIKNTNKTLNQI